MAERWTVEHGDAGCMAYDLEDYPCPPGLTVFASRREALEYALLCDLEARDEVTAAIARHRAALRRLATRRNPQQQES